jgi:phosphohistidine swiveling domain-containing protein
MSTIDWNTSLTGDYLWARQEPFPEVMTPSTWSLWGHTYLATQVGGVQSLGNIGGRLYLNISLPYSLLRKFGKSHQESADIFTLMTGPLPQGVEIPLIPVSILGLLRDVAPVAVKMALLQRKLRSNYDQIIATSPERCQDLRAQIQETAQKSDLVTLWNEQVHPMFTEFSLLQDAFNEDYRTPYMSLRARLTKLIGEADANALLSTLGGGSQQLSTIGPLVDLSRVARDEMSRQAYTTLYGHRHANENELAQPRPYEDPDWLDRQLAELRASGVDVQALLKRRAAEFELLWGNFEARYPRDAGRLGKAISAFNEAMHKREAIRSEYTRSVGVARALFLRAGELLGLGDDVFFLTKDELVDVLSGDDQAVAHIPARRERYETYSALPTYPGWIRGRFDPVQWASDPARRQDIFDAHATVPSASEGNTLRGYPGSAGSVEGLVRCVESLEQGDQLQPGEILVAVTTNVGWTPLFPRAAAVVTDIGAPLAHAAIVARELGIPAVVGCGNATARLKTGDRVRVDGGQGTVEILETGGA